MSRKFEIIKVVVLLTVLSLAFAYTIHISTHFGMQAKAEQEFCRRADGCEGWAYECNFNFSKVPMAEDCYFYP